MQTCNDSVSTGSDNGATLRLVKLQSGKVKVSIEGGPVEMTAFVPFEVLSALVATLAGGGA